MLDFPHCRQRFKIISWCETVTVQANVSRHIESAHCFVKTVLGSRPIRGMWLSHLCMRPWEAGQGFYVICALGHMARRGLFSLSVDRSGKEGHQGLGTTVTEFRAADTAAQAAAACRAASGKAARLSMGSRTIPLASWTGARLGARHRLV